MLMYSATLLISLILTALLTFDAAQLTNAQLEIDGDELILGAGDGTILSRRVRDVDAMLFADSDNQIATQLDAHNSQQEDANPADQEQQSAALSHMHAEQAQPNRNNADRKNVAISPMLI